MDTGYQTPTKETTVPYLTTQPFGQIPSTAQLPKKEKTITEETPGKAEYLLGYRWTKMEIVSIVRVSTCYQLNIPSASMPCLPKHKRLMVYRMCPSLTLLARTLPLLSMDNHQTKTHFFLTNIHHSPDVDAARTVQGIASRRQSTDHP